MKNEFIVEFIRMLDAKNSFLELSQYVPGPKGVTLSREVKRVSPTMADLNSCFKDKIKGADIAIHNVVRVGRTQRFIPMIDLSISVFDDINLSKVSKLIDVPFYVYSSGRSYHVYFMTLLKHSEWIKFLGKCLLMNDRNTPFEIVDSRWIGHSLEKNYSALRITANNAQYLKKPELVMIGNEG